MLFGDLLHRNFKVNNNNVMYIAHEWQVIFNWLIFNLDTYYSLVSKYYLYKLYLFFKKKKKRKIGRAEPDE